MLQVRPPGTPEDGTWAGALWRQEWGGDVMMSKGQPHHMGDLHLLIGWRGSERVGLAAYRCEAAGAELVSINAVEKGAGIGSVMLDAVERFSLASGLARIWLVTSNDNLDALRFYQRRGYRIVAVHRGAVDRARQLKPSIPREGFYDIPVHDEMELEKLLT